MVDIQQLQEKVAQAIAKKPDYQAGPFELRVSAAGDCPRLLDYKLQEGRSAPTPQQSMRLMMGNYTHLMWQDLLKEALGDDLVGLEEELSFEVDGVTVKGHPDGEIKSFDCIWEFKSTSKSTFDMVAQQDHPIPAHYEQANMYAHVKKRAFILFHYFCRDNGESLFFVGPYNEMYAQASIEKMRVRIANRKAGIIGPRPYNDPTGTPCWYCEKKAKCYEGFADEVKEMGRAELSHETEPELFSFVAEADKHRTLRLTSEKIEEARKKDIANKLHALKLSSVKISTFSVDLKLGKNQNSIINIRSLGDKA